MKMQTIHLPLSEGDSLLEEHIVEHLQADCASRSSVGDFNFTDK